MEYSHHTTKNMQCPSCGSHSTQAIGLAYSQAVRVGDSGRETVSRFGQALAPPPEKDEKFVPGLVACFVLGISLITLPALLNKTGIPALSNLPTISWKVAVISCIAAWAVGLLIAMPRIRYNVMKLPKLLEEWRSQVICRRCGHRWQDLSASKHVRNGGVSK